MELPLVVVILTALGLVTPQFLARNRRYALAIAAVAAALLAPPDALSMLVGIVLLMALYEVSIGCAWVVTKRRAAASRPAEGAPPGSSPCCSSSAAPSTRRHRPSRGATRHDAADRRGLGGAGPPRHGDRPPAGLPTGPTRSFPASDAVIDSLLKLHGYRITAVCRRYAHRPGRRYPDDSSARRSVRGARGTKLESDSIRYHQRSCRLDASGIPACSIKRR